VLRAIIDSSYTRTLPDSMAGAPEALLDDHFDDVEGGRASDVAEWVADSIPDIPRELIRDFARVATDRSRIEPFALGRSRLRLLSDSTLARFFGRLKPGWEGFRRAFPQGGGIVSVSRVGLTHDGRWAMVYVGSQGDWLAGAGFVYVLHHDGGIWRIRHRQLLWIS
jgi:hypothetical protein